MIATVDIKTGEKTIVDYLIKPFNRAKERCASGKSLKIRRYGAGHACHKSVILTLHIGADSGFDGICETQGACRGAVGLVKAAKNSRKRRNLRFSSLITCLEPSLPSLRS